jgi:AP-3 complex subunit mu
LSVIVHDELIPLRSRPIIQSGFRSSTAAYPLLHIDAFNNALAKSQRAEDVDPILVVPPINAGEGPSACCHVLHEGIRFLCPISGDGTSHSTDSLFHGSNKVTVDPLFAFAFLQTFVDILLEYFGSFSLETLKENFDVVYQVFVSYPVLANVC